MGGEGRSEPADRHILVPLSLAELGESKLPVSVVPGQGLRGQDPTAPRHRAGTKGSDAGRRGRGEGLRFGGRCAEVAGLR